MSEHTRTLSSEERADLRRLLDGEEGTVSLLLHGEGEDRMLSFYLDGTRNETRIAYPEGSEDA